MSFLSRKTTGPADTELSAAGANMMATAMPAVAASPQPASHGIFLLPLSAKTGARPVANIIVVAESGHGKTTSLENLDWASGKIAFIDTELKGFDWQHKIPEDCYFKATSGENCLAIMRHVESNPKFEIAVVDSFTDYGITANEDCKSKAAGYEAYKLNTTAIVKFLKAARSSRVRWIVLAVPELLTMESTGNTSGVVIKRASVMGREMEGKVEAAFAYAVYIKIVSEPGKRNQYFFVLQSDGKSQAKIPRGVTEALQIPSDMNGLLKLIEKSEAKV